MSDFVGGSPRGLAHLKAELGRAEKAIDEERQWLQQEVVDDPEVLDIVRVLLRAKKDLASVKSEVGNVVNGVFLLGMLGIRLPGWVDKASKIGKQVAMGGNKATRAYWRARLARGRATPAQEKLVRKVHFQLRKPFVLRKLEMKANLRLARGLPTRDKAARRAALERYRARKDVLHRLRGRPPAPPVGRVGRWTLRIRKSAYRRVGRTRWAGAVGRFATRTRAGRFGPWIARAGRTGRFARGAGRLGSRALGPLAAGLDAYDTYKNIRKGNYRKAAYSGVRTAGSLMLLNPATAPFGAALIAGSYVVEHRKKIGKAIGKAGGAAKKAAKKAKKKLKKFFGF